MNSFKRRSEMMCPVNVEWKKFTKLTQACSRFAKTPCVYVQTDSRACRLRIGRASEGLEARYRGGTGYAIDAAMHGSRNLIFVPAVDKGLCARVEVELIWRDRHFLRYNNVGKIVPPIRRILLSHLGTPPLWAGFDTELIAASATSMRAKQIS